MNCDVKRSPNVMTDGAMCMRDVVALTTERIQQFFHRPDSKRLSRELDVRMEERRLERARIARDLHDTLFQGFFGVSLLLHDAVEKVPADSPGKPSLCRVLCLMQRVINEGRDAVYGLRSPTINSMSLEHALSGLRDEFRPESAVRIRIFVSGQSRALKPAVHEQVYLIVREALVNALRHSEARSIEAEVEYLSRRLRVVVRDNGRGIDPEVVQSGRDGHWGIASMRERAEKISARLTVRSRATAGTEIELSVPNHIAFQHQSSYRPLGWLARIYPRKTRANDSKGMEGAK
jgi:signal transduction histidine kinase